MNPFKPSQTLENSGDKQDLKPKYVGNNIQPKVHNLIFIGKIFSIILPDKPLKELKFPDDNQSTQAIIEVWDDNTVLAFVIPELIEKLKEGDIVIYQWISNPQNPQAMQAAWVVKILKGEQGVKAWKKFREQNKRNQDKNQNLTPPEFLADSFVA